MARECLRRGHDVRLYINRWEGDAAPDLNVVMVPVTAVTNHDLYERYAAWVNEHRRQHPVHLLVGMNKMPGLDVYYAGDSCFEEKARTQRGSFYRALPRYHHFARSEAAVFDNKAATEILTLSDSQTPFFRKHYNTRAERFHGLPPGIEPDRAAIHHKPEKLAEYRATIRTELKVGDDEQLLLFIGSGFIKKGLDRALLALHALPPQQYAKTWLCVIGKDNAEPFRRMAKRLGVFERVFFFDEGRPDVPQFLFAGDALVLPAYDELAGMVILEAMVAGLPLLVTENCGYAHYLQKFGGGLITAAPFDQQAFNDQVFELLTSHERVRWSADGRAAANHKEIFRLTGTAVDYLEQFAQRKVPIVAFALFKYFPFGGLQRDFIKVARACVARGWRVRIYTLSWEAEPEPGMDVQLVEVGGVINHVRYERFSKKVAEDLEWFPVDALVGFNKMPNLDLYYAADSCYEQKAQELRSGWYRNSPRYRFFSRFERAVFEPKAKTKIFLITNDQQVQFQKYYKTPAERFELLPPNVSSDRARGADAQAVRTQFRQHYQIQDDELLLLLIGSGFITKGLDRVLLAFASLPPALRDKTRLHVVGEDTPKQFVSMSEELGISEQVTIFSGREDIPRYLQGADLMVHPAYMESGGIVLLESMIAGLPLITTANCGFAHYVATADAGVVLPDPFVQQTLNRELERLLANPAERQRLSERGLAFAEEADLFSMPERMVDGILEAIRQRYPQNSDFDQLEPRHDQAISAR